MVVVPKAWEDRKQHQDGQSQFSLNPTPDSGFGDSCELTTHNNSPKTQWVSVLSAGSFREHSTWKSSSPLPCAQPQLSKAVKPLSCNLRVNFALLKPTESLINSPRVCYPLTAAVLAYSCCIPDIQLG